MATTVLSLVEELRDQLNDYGEAVTALSSAMTDTTGTTANVSSSSGFEALGFAYCDFEAFEVSATGTGTLTVRRGARGTAAATHLSGAVVRFNLTWGNQLILNKLNEALDAAYPDLYTLVEDSDSLVTVSDQYVYELPTTIDKLYRVEVESESTSDIYIPCNAWDLIDESHIKIYDINQWNTGQKINLVGIAPFSTATATGNLDSDYPITDGNAKGYLMSETMGRLLMVPQARIAKRDSFVGKTDGWDNSQPYMSMAVAREYMKQAKEFLVKCRMRLPAHTIPNPGRSFLYAGQ